MVEGVSNGFEKQLEIVGVGYRAQKQGKNLVLNVGYSHPVTIEPPEDVEIDVSKNNEIVVKGINKEIVGQVAAKIEMFGNQSLIKVKVSNIRTRQLFVK